MRNQNGFTILELSIVLTIIALIVGGIMIGQELLRGAEMRGIPTESRTFIDAIKMFQDKYNNLPGDMLNARDYWPSASYGDSDGTITDSEEFISWQHLAFAGFIEGSYTATAGSQGALDREPGVNVPKSLVSGAGWGLLYMPVANAAVSATYKMIYVAGDTAPGHVLWFGGRSATGLNNLMEPVLTAIEAELVDQKMDDGFPGTGKITAQYNTGTYTNCHSSNTAYNVAVEGRICALVFKTGY